MTAPSNEQLVAAWTAEMNPHRSLGVSTAVMPNGSFVCLTHDAPYELAIAMSVEWARARAFAKDAA